MDAGKHCIVQRGEENGWWLRKMGLLFGIMDGDCS